MPKNTSTEALKVLQELEKDLKSQLSDIQRAITALQPRTRTRVVASTGRGRKAAKPAPRRRKAMTAEQRKAISERMRKYWVARREQKKG